MPVPMKITGRSSTITNSFVNSIIPIVYPSNEEITEALFLLGMNHESIECSYCGDAYSEWDHLRPLVKDKLPTGYISEIQNLVPSCGKCNQSKGNTDWYSWILGDAPKSPKTRGVPDLEVRVERIKDYMGWREPTLVDFEEVVGADLWKEHWENCQKIQDLLIESQRVSERIKECFPSEYMNEDQYSEIPGLTVPEMRIGALVRHYLPQIFSFIESRSNDLLSKLQDQDYSNRIFGVHYPFLLKTYPDRAREPRYWSQCYEVDGEYFRVTSEWYEDRSRDKFLKFIRERGVDIAD